MLNFNGGTLSASQSSANFMTVSTALLYSGGATINTGSNNITIAAALTAPAGNGIGLVGSTILPSNSGSGYVTPPFVTFAAPAGGGIAATGYSELNADGSLKDIVITSPGSGYGASESVAVTLASGSGGGSGAAFASVTAATANIGGGLTKLGSGTLTLGAANTFGGLTAIDDGVLVMANTAALQGSTLNYNNNGGTINFGILTSATMGGLSGPQSLALPSNFALTVG